MENSDKNRFYFSSQVDSYLSKEVYAQNPYEDPKRWVTVQENLYIITGRTISIRTLKDRMQNLIKKFIGKNRKNEGSSGIEENITELDDIIQQIIDLMKTYQKKDVKKTSFQKGFEAREEFVKLSHIQEAPSINTTVVNENVNNETLHGEDTEENQNIPENIISNTRKRTLAQRNILTPSGKRRTHTNVRHETVQYLDKKHDKQYELRCKELTLEENKQNLKERQLEMDLKERQKRLELDERRINIEEKRANTMMQLFENQHILIKLICETFKNN